MEQGNKKEVLEAMLSKGDALLCIDSRRTGVQVPKNHLNKSDLRLILNLQFRHPVNLLAEGIQADLLFSGELHHCWIPYDSLWAVFNPVSGEGALWAESLPEELHGLPERIGQGSRDPSVPSGQGVSVVREDRKGPVESLSRKEGHTTCRDLESVPREADPSARKPSGQVRSHKPPFLRVIPGGKKD